MDAVAPGSPFQGAQPLPVHLDTVVVTGCEGPDDIAGCLFDSGLQLVCEFSHAPPSGPTLNRLARPGRVPAGWAWTLPSPSPAGRLGPGTGSW